jgi:hypothetical protein
VLYLVMAIAMMAPLAPRQLPASGAQDVCNHVCGIIEARHALAEGQFPIRVAPHQNQQTRYPIFQFYGNLPYTVGGALYAVTGANPYRVWKTVVTACLVLGGFFTYRCGRVLTRQPLPAVVAGAVFLTAPYLLTDIHGRFAYCEIVSFTLLPMVFYFAWRSFVRRDMGKVLAGGVAWSCLFLSHNLTFLYASLFFGVFFFSWLWRKKGRKKGSGTFCRNGPEGASHKRCLTPFFAWRKRESGLLCRKPPKTESEPRKLITRWLRVGAAYALGLGLSLWALAPQRQLVPYLPEGLLWPVQDCSWLTPLGVLLAPAVASPVHLPTIYIDSPAHFGLQVGWPILVAVGLALCGLRRGLGYAVQVRLLLLFGMALFATWSPFDFWSALPELFSYVQFSYRLLMFVVLWGALLAALALARSFAGKMLPAHVALAVLALGWTASPYLTPHRADKNLSIDKEIAQPEMGRGGAGVAYTVAGRALVETTLVHPDVDWAAAPTGGLLDPMHFYATGQQSGAFPAPCAGDALRLEGAVVATPKTPLRLTVTMDGQILARPTVPPGPFQLTIPLPACPDKNRVHVAVQGDPISERQEPPHPRMRLSPSYQLTRFALQPGPGRSETRRLVAADQVRPQVTFGHPTTVRLRLSEPSLVQLPVLYYPGLLRLEHNGQRVPVQHLGRFVAVELPPGDHHVRVRFVGIRWANAVSWACWIGVAVAAGALLVRRLLRRRTAQPETEDHAVFLQRREAA